MAISRSGILTPYVCVCRHNQKEIVGAVKIVTPACQDLTKLCSLTKVYPFSSSRRSIEGERTPLGVPSMSPSQASAGARPIVPSVVREI